jgi:endogenous inhibitor of DNA gyrase (YacG/DUF329 family)
MSKQTIPSRAGKTCPLCGKASQLPLAPFCSQGCKDRDLLNWLGDAYRVLGRPAEEDEPEIDLNGVDSEA